MIVPNNGIDSRFQHLGIYHIIMDIEQQFIMELYCVSFNVISFIYS